MDLRNVIFHVFITSLLATAFVTQSVLLNRTLIEFFHFSPTSFLWFLWDFICLLSFCVNAFIGYRRSEDRSRREISVSPEKQLLSKRHQRPTSASSENTSRHDWPSNAPWFRRAKKLPTSCYAYLLYAAILIAKITTIFKMGIADSADSFLKPQELKMTIGLTAIVFSFLVEAHKDTHHEPLRNAYVNTLAFGVATEILDTLSFLSLLIASQSGLIYSFHFEVVVLALAAINILLPAIALLNLSVSAYGKTFSVPCETIHKLLHFFLVNMSYLGIRLYLWIYLTPDTSVFIIKNAYCILVFMRDGPQEILQLLNYFHHRKQMKKINGIEMGLMTSNGGGGGGGGASTLLQHQVRCEPVAALEEEEGAGDANLPRKLVCVVVEEETEESPLREGELEEEEEEEKSTTKGECRL